MGNRQSYKYPKRDADWVYDTCNSTKQLLAKSLDPPSMAILGTLNPKP